MKTKTEYKFTKPQKDELKVLKKYVIDYIEEYLDIYCMKFPNLYCYKDSDDFNKEKFKAIIKHLGLKK